MARPRIRLANGESFHVLREYLPIREGQSKPRARTICGRVGIIVENYPEVRPSYQCLSCNRIAEARWNHGHGALRKSSKQAKRRAGVDKFLR